NAKSRVETQIKITLRLTTDGGERVTCWSHLALPEMLVSREKFRHRLQKHAPGESGMPASPQHVVHLEAGVICSSDPTRKVETCIGCIRREYKRSLRRKDARLRSSAVQSACTTPAQSRAPSPTSGSPSDAKGMTGTMEADWDKARIAVEKQRIVIFNCNDLLDFSKGEVVLPTRITCYCRHHNEKVGFCICLTLRDSQGAVLKTLMSPPIMITDDHKSTKFKTDRKIKTKAEYERQGDGNAAYANHALSGLGSPHGVGSHLTESPSGHLGFRGGRQAMSARNSPTLRPYGHPHMLLDTYSQFASLAGTPSLNNSPIGSPPMVASHMVGGGGFESSFHLPQAALGGGYHVSGPSLFSNLAGSPAVGSDTATAAAAAATAALVANYNSHGQQHQQQQHHHHHHHQQMSNPDGSSTLAPPGMLPISSMYGTMPGQHMSMSSTLGLHPSLSSGVGPVFSGDSLSAAGLVAPQAGHGSDSSIRIAQMMPAQGPVVGGTSVLIAGRGFHPNIAVYFGTAQASRVQVLSSFNMTCVLPPSKASGPVAVRIRDLSTMTVYEGNGSVADLNSSTLQSSNHSIFTYINDTDQAMLELALQIIGLLPNDKSSSASGTSASPQMSPVMQTRSPGSSRMSSPTGAAQQNAKNKIIQDQSIMGVLRALRTANDSHDMEEIEAHLLKLLSTVLSRSIIESSRLNTAHEATGRLLIHFASLLGMVNLARFLVSNGALFDETDNSGMTALHLACMYNENASVVELLLNSGASFRVKSNLAQTPLDIAQSVGNKKAQMLLEEREGYSKFIKEDHLAENTGEAKSISVSGVSSEPTANMFHQSFAAGMMPAGNVAVDAQGHSSVAGLFSHAGGGSEAAIFSDGSGLFGSSLLFGSQQQQQNQHLHLSNPNMQPPYHQQHYQQ
ncbi:SPT3 Dosage dependent suppressor of Ty-induced promoter mutations-like protein, partial [Coemansia asiatica]